VNDAEVKFEIKELFKWLANEDSVRDAYNIFIYRFFKFSEI